MTFSFGRSRLTDATPGRAGLCVALTGILLCAAWLLPNHYPPWNTFHTSAAVALALFLMASAVLWAKSGKVPVSSAAAWLLACSFIPALQYAAGIIPLASDALLSFLHLAGLAAAFVLGEHWQRLRAWQPVVWMLGAAALASGASVGLQLYQWFGLASDLALTDIWIMSFGDAARPYANLGQPNQLASLHLWGLLGLACLAQRRVLSSSVTYLCATLITLGLALTESRTAILTASVLVAWLTLRKPAAVPPKARLAVQALYAWMWVCLLALEPLGKLVHLEIDNTVLMRSAGELRGTIWSMAIEASMVRPWQGWGWHRGGIALLDAFPRFARLDGQYMRESHNLVLDLVLWVGWPLALVLTACVARWLYRMVRAAGDLSQVICLCAIIVLVAHAMSELPLHYGYFLWPLGLLAGAANAACSVGAAAPLFQVPRALAVAALSALFATTVVIVHDYVEVEAAVADTRFKMLKIGTTYIRPSTKPIFLKVWPEYLHEVVQSSQPGLDDRALNRLREVMLYNVAPGSLRRLALTYAANGRPDEARYWAVRTCAVLARLDCLNVQRDVNTRINELQPAQTSAAP